MKHRQTRSIFASAPVVWLCLLAFCNPAAGSETDTSAVAVDKAVAEPAHAEEQTDTQPEDVVDRIFAPLDDAVSDINRDINKDDTSTPAGPSE